MITDGVARVPLASSPTPIEPLDRLSEELGGPRLFVKRDDLTGLASGGNKARKLEFLLAEALRSGADTLVTSGAVQSNQARQSAAAAARLGLACDLVLVRPIGEEPRRGNLLLDELLGARIHWAARKAELPRAVEETAAALRGRGRRPYVVPYGASNPLGALGYVVAMEEIASQGSFDLIVTASSSGGTQAGLLAGARLLGVDSRILGISVDVTAADLQATVAELASEATTLLGHSERFAPAEVEVNADYLGGGYAVVGALERSTIRLVARQEGLLLDPVYTGRAFGGLLDMIRRGRLDTTGDILFIHTGGTPALFAFDL